jgi:putative ABC transport system permease protein
MWRNYLIVGLRALAKSRIYAAINILGLAVGMAACLMILLYVRYELSYDRWLPNAENIYQIQSWSTDSETGDEFKLRMSQYVASTALQKDFPQIERRVYALSAGPVVIRDGQALSTEDVVRVDAPFFDVFAFPFLHGSPATALAQPGTVALSKSEAIRLYGKTDVVGETLTVIERGKHIPYRVTGVFRDLPRNSHMKLTMVIRFDPLTYFATDYPDFTTTWGEISGWGYVALKPGTDPKVITDQLAAWEKRNIPDQSFEGKAENPGEFQEWKLVNIRDVHLGEAQEAAMRPGNDRTTIVTFAVVAMLILGIACVNFVNLATARASQRAREVALRKVLGATRLQLIVQFIGESLLIAGFAMVVALALVEVTLPWLAAFLDADLKLQYWGENGITLPIIGLLVLVGAAGGVYPALYLSRYKPAQVLKANKSSAESAGTGRLRGILVVAQFAVSIGLIICTSVIYAQTVFARTADPGFTREGLLQVNIGYRGMVANSEAFARAVERVPGVKSVARTAIGVSTGSTMGRAVRVPGRADTVNVGNYAVDEGFFRTMGIKLLAGRLLERNRLMDETSVPYPEPNPDAERALAARGGNVVINALAAERLGFRSPEDAVGKEVRVGLSLDTTQPLVPVRIVGVVADSRFRTIRTPVEPIMYRIGQDYLSALMVRYDDPNPAAVRDRIAAVWKRFAPDLPFEAEFSEDIVAELYLAEQARATIFAGFSTLAILIGCLGLFGLATFTAERRTKEIGIRKVLGATTRDIVRLLVWQFTRPVIVANLIAWPIAWWVMRDWLNSFDTRIALGPTPFVVAGLIAFTIAIVTVAAHAMRIARTNPIHALRYE